MKSMKTGAASGCIVWVILVGLVSSCILPVSFFVGGFTSFTTPAIQITGKIICPSGTTPTSYSYETTSRDEYGNYTPSTAYELHCLDAQGKVVKNDPIGYAFLWDGIILAAGLILAAIISLVIAAPAGALIARFLARIKIKNNSTPN